MKIPLSRCYEKIENIYSRLHVFKVQAYYPLKMAPGKKEPKRRKYSNETLRQAIAALKTGRSLRAISREYNIPKSTLLMKSKETAPKLKRGGPPTVLNANEEEKLVKWLMQMSTSGFPINKSVLVDSAQALIKSLKRDNPFTNNRPGRSWFDGFLQRHPMISQRIAENLSFSREAITEAAIRNWFAELKIRLDREGLIDIAPVRVFNCDETAFFLNPKGEKILVKKRDKSAYNFLHNDEKECLTTLFMANAAGTIAPPMVLYTYERVPASVFASSPESWKIGKTDNGWTTGESFYDYITNTFYPWLEETNIDLPIILYLDGRSSYLTMVLSEYCQTHGIILVAFCPNSTDFIQPLDVALFQPLKRAWQQEALQWRMENSGIRMRRENFAPLLEQALATIDISEVLHGGFENCGLHPINPDAVNYEKIGFRVKPVVTKMVKETIQPQNKDAENILTFIEQFIDPDSLVKFRRVEGHEEWNGTLEDRSLFRVWKAIKQRVYT